MSRLLRTLLLAAAATGTAYLVIYLRGGETERPVSERRRSRATDEEEFTREEQDQILRELSGLV